MDTGSLARMMSRGRLPAQRDRAQFAEASNSKYGRKVLAGRLMGCHLEYEQKDFFRQRDQIQRQFGRHVLDMEFESQGTPREDLRAEWHS
jgi:hypothetical protein